MYRALILTVVTYIILVAYLQIPEVTQYDSKRILQIFTLIVIGILFLFSLTRGLWNGEKSLDFSFTYSRITAITLIILFIAGLTSVILAPNFKYALLEFSFLFLLFLLIFAIAPYNLKDHFFLGKAIFATALGFSGIYLIIFFGNYISSFLNPMIAQWPEKYNFTLTINEVELVGKEILYFDHRRFFNHTQTWSIPILIGFLTYFQGIKKNNLVATLLTIFVGFWWMLIFASGGRGSVVGIISAFILIIFIWRKDALQLMKNGISTIIIGGIFYFIFFKLLVPDSGGTPILRSTDSGRYSMWEYAIELWLQNPLFGIGPMHYAQITAEPYFAHPHNFYIQILSEWGIVSFIAFAVLCIIFIKMAYRNYEYSKRNSSNQTIYLAFIWSVLAAFIHAFFSGVMHTPMSQMWLVLMLAWFIGFKRNNTSLYKFSLNYKSFYIVYLILLATVIFLVQDDMLNLIETNLQYISTYPESRFNPRFWVQGLFE